MVDRLRPRDLTFLEEETSTAPAHNATIEIFECGDSGFDYVRLLELNPVTGLVVSFRNIVVLDHAPAFRLLAYDAAFAVVILAVGAWAFGRWQRVFSEIV